MIVASVARTEEEMVDGVQAGDRPASSTSEISDPVTPYITGTPTIDLATKDEALDAARRAELLALPILFLVLLLDPARAGRGARADGASAARRRSSASAR